MPPSDPGQLHHTRSRPSSSSAVITPPLESSVQWAKRPLRGTWQDSLWVDGNPCLVGEGWCLGTLLHLKWDGPYAFYDADDGKPVEAAPKHPGVYVWTAPLDDGVYYPIEVGETHSDRRDLPTRLCEWRGLLEDGRIWIYDVEALKHGEIEAVYRLEERDQQARNWEEPARRYGEFVRLFVLPITLTSPPVEMEELCKRIEAEVALRIGCEGNASRVFWPAWSSFRRKTDSDVPITVHSVVPYPIAGLRSVMWI